MAPSGQSLAQIPQLVHFSVSMSIELLHGQAIIPITSVVFAMERRGNTDLTFL
jgi:hypothetical protein